ncbi:MAG: hypothetical protein U0804_23535 [Gemmataceae bacterium]
MLRAMCVLAATALSAGGSAAPLPDVDPMLAGTKWVGTLSQRGSFRGGAPAPPAFQAALTVTRRHGDRFEGELDEVAGPIRVTYVVKGVVGPAPGGKGHTVSFRSVGTTLAQSTVPVLDVPYAGVLRGRNLTGTWKAAGTGGANVEGDFALEMGR